MLNRTRCGHIVSTLVALLVLPAALNACSSPPGVSSNTTAGSTTSSTPSTDSRTVQETACALISSPVVSSSMGTTVGVPKSVVKGPVTVCTYRAINPSKSVVIRYDIASSQSAFTADESVLETHHQAISAVTGLGDEAYSTSVSTGQGAVNTVVARQNSLEVLVTGTAPLSNTLDLVQAILTKVQAASASTTTTSG